MKLTLSKGIKEKNYKVRKAVAQCIKDGAGKDLKDTILMLLKNQDNEIRLNTIRTLGKIGDFLCKDMVNLLLPGVQKEDPSEEVRKEAALVLKKFETD